MYWDYSRGSRAGLFDYIFPWVKLWEKLWPVAGTFPSAITVVLDVQMTQSATTFSAFQHLFNTTHKIIVSAPAGFQFR